MANEEYRYLRCDKCGQVNRLPREKFEAGSVPKCGKCKSELSVEPHPAMVTDQNFESFTNAPVPVLIDFWAPWCGPCHMLAPTIEQIAKDFAGQIFVGKLNTDENQATAAKFHIQGIPSVILFSQGREAERLVGVRPKADFVRSIQPLLG